MAVYRNVQLSFWTDNKVEDDFTPEDKYFYLYLLTNPQTNICGCYEVSWFQLTSQTGYNKETVIRLLDRFENIHKIIKFNKNTKEILILNWYKYNWSKSPDVVKGVLKVAEHIKSKEFKKYVLNTIKKIENRTVLGQSYYTMETSVSDTDSVSVSDSNTDIYKEIVNYLNSILDSNYKYTTRKTQDCIKARLNEGFTVDDFKTVIDKKSKEWLGTDMERYLRPETLFGTKFEGYLNQTGTTKATDKPKRQGVKWE